MRLNQRSKGRPLDARLMLPKSLLVDRQTNSFESQHMLGLNRRGLSSTVLVGREGLSKRPDDQKIKLKNRKAALVHTFQRRRYRLTSPPRVHRPKAHSPTQQKTQIGASLAQVGRGHFVHGRSDFENKKLYMLREYSQIPLTPPLAWPGEIQAVSAWPPRDLIRLRRPIF